MVEMPTLSVAADGVATLQLNRPQHMNRLHREDLLALQQMFVALRHDGGVRVLVLTATGRVFCAGSNIGELDGPDDPRLFEHTVEALEALPMPTILRFNGSVYGGATDLALACDFRIGVQGMELRMPAARLGLHYYPSGLQRYVSRLGLPAAKRLFLLADNVPADELLRIGYLDALVAPEALDAEVARVAALLLAGAPLALRGMKQSLNEIARGEFELGHLREREALCATSDDLREGIAAFAEKRPPRFSGR
jgi:enoyl-CoA hydratase